MNYVLLFKTQDIDDVSIVVDATIYLAFTPILTTASVLVHTFKESSEVTSADRLVNEPREQC